MAIASQAASPAEHPSRALLLALFALLVTWLSGLEPMYGKVAVVAARFHAINVQRQEADNTARQQQLQANRARVPTREAAFFAFQYPTAQARQHELQRRYQALTMAHKAVASPAPPALKPMNEVCNAPEALQDMARITTGTKAQQRLVSTATTLLAFCRLDKVDTQAAKLQSEALKARQSQQLAQSTHALNLAYKEARQSASAIQTDVDFELLGLKFKAPALWSPILWLASALVWLTMLRQERRALAPATSAGSVAPGLLALVVLTWLVALRVLWMGLGLASGLDSASVQGAPAWKATVALGLITLVAACAWVGHTLMAPPTADTPAPSPAPGKTAQVVGLLLLAVLVGWCWHAPGQVLHTGQLLRPATPWLALCLLWPWLQALRSTPGGSAQAAHRQQGGLRRRTMLVGSLLLVAAASWALAVRHKPAIPPTANWLRRQKKRRGAQARAAQARQAVSGLPSGFYKRVRPGKQTQRPVIWHYLPHGLHVLPGSPLPLASQLAKQAPALAPALPLGAASWSVENAAVDLLARYGCSQANVRQACALLQQGLAHDARYKRNHPHVRKQGAPSFRLYDLLAGLAVRFDLPEVLDDLAREIKNSDQQLVLESRLQKWRDPRSPWRQRWANKRVPQHWQTNLRALVF